MPTFRPWFLDRGVWCDHPGQRHREHEGAGRPIVYDELRARVSSWPPLQLARLRRERGSVVVVSPAAPVIRSDRGGADATRDRDRYPPNLWRGGDLGRRAASACGPGRHDPDGAGGLRQEPLADRRGGDRGDRQLHGGVAGAVALREAGGDRQSAAGEGDRACPCEDRQGRRRARSPASMRPAICPRSGRRMRRPSASPAGGAALPGRAPSHADQERGAFDPARASDPEVPACGPVQRAAAGPG